MISNVLQIMGIHMGDELDEDHLDHPNSSALIQEHNQPDRNDFLARLRIIVTKKKCYSSCLGLERPVIDLLFIRYCTTT